MGRIGFDNVAGYLAGGMRAVEHRPDLVRRNDGITAPALAAWLTDGPGSPPGDPVVLDIRSEAEHAGGHLPGSLNIPLPQPEARIDELPAARPVDVHCEGGYRSANGASLLGKLGRAGVFDLVGGYKACMATQPSPAPPT